MDSNQNHLHSDHIIASMLKEIDNSIYDSIKQVQAGTAPFGTLFIVGRDARSTGSLECVVSTLSTHGRELPGLFLPFDQVCNRSPSTNRACKKRS